MEYNCDNCGRTAHGRAVSGPMGGYLLPSGWKKSGGLFSKKVFCSNRCKDEYNDRNS